MKVVREEKHLGGSSESGECPETGDGPAVVEVDEKIVCDERHRRRMAAEVLHGGDTECKEKLISASRAHGRGGNASPRCTDPGQLRLILFVQVDAQIGERASCQFGKK